MIDQQDERKGADEVMVLVDFVETFVEFFDDFDSGRHQEGEGK